MNNTVNESVLDLVTTAGPLLVGVLLFSMLSVFLITGYSMKFALAAAGVGRFGFWKSIGIVFLSTLATMVVSVIAVVVAPENPIVMLASAILGVVACVMVIAMVGRCGMGMGFKAYLYNGLFGTIGMVIFAVCLAAVLIVAGPSIKIDEEALAQLRENMPKQGQASDASFDQNSEDRFGSLTNVSFSSGDFGAGTEKTIEGSQIPATHSTERFVAPVISSSNEEVQNAFYRSVPKMTTETGRSESMNNTFKGVRENPFVK